MKNEYDTYTIDHWPGFCYFLRHPNGDVVRNRYDVPYGFLTHRAASGWLRAKSEQEAERLRLDAEIEREMET